MSIQKYIQVYKTNITRFLLEKEITFIWSLEGALTLFTIIFVWLAGDKRNVGGYTREQLISYYFFIYFIERIVGWWVFWDILNHIKDGGIANFLIKPINYFLYISVKEFAYKTVSTLLHVLVAFCIYLIFYNRISFDFSIEKVVLLIPSLLLAVGINLLIHTAMGYITFFWTDANFLADFHWILMTILGGQMVPITFFPESLRLILIYNPLRYTFSFSAEIISGRIVGEEILYGFVIGIMWLITLGTLVNILWRIGLKKFSAVGL
jgi:ABC-2 type transport system permease protein